MLDEVTGVSDNTGNLDLSIGKFDVLPDLPFVIVAGV
jgi:hypothetical protein